MQRLFKLNTSGKGRGRKRLEATARRRARRDTDAQAWCVNVRVGTRAGRSVYRRATLATDSRVSGQWAVELQKAVDRRLNNEPPDAEAFKRLPERLLVQFGLKHPVSETRREPYASHVEQYVRELGSAGRAAMYVRNTRGYLLRTAAACGWRTLGDANRDSLVAYLETCRSKGRTAVSVNNVLRAHRTFFRWCVDLRRLDENPAQAIKRFDDAGSRARRRRALERHEVARLLALAGPRELIYRVLV